MESRTSGAPAQINSLRGNVVSKANPAVRRGGVSEGGLPRWAVMILLFLALGLVRTNEQTHNPVPQSYLSAAQGQQGTTCASCVAFQSIR